MLVKWMGALFAPKYPRHYTGRHRAPGPWWHAEPASSLDNHDLP
jgi:hypothetical protein